MRHFIPFCWCSEMKLAPKTIEKMRERDRKTERNTEKKKEDSKQQKIHKTR